MKLISQPGQTVWFTSDTHYAHSNICRATTKWQNADNVTRDFKSLDAMNDAIVNNINAKVMPDDILFHLGDFSFGGIDNVTEFRNRINCKTVHLILGNHDDHILRPANNLQGLFSSVQEYLFLDFRMYAQKGKDRITVMRQDFVLSHYPIQSWRNMNNSSIHLHGHVHLPYNRRVAKGKMMDVGVDGNAMDPISLREVMQIMAKQPIASNLPFDHHIDRVE